MSICGSVNLKNSQTCRNYSSTTRPCHQFLSQHIIIHRMNSVFWLVVAPFALLSNFSFLITIKKTTCLRKIVAIHLVALSCVDKSISICYIITAFRFLFYLKNVIINYGLIAPFLLRFPLQFSASILVVSVTADRYRAVSNPFQSVSFVASCRLWLMIVVTTVLSVIVPFLGLIDMVFLSLQGYKFDCLNGNQEYVSWTSINRALRTPSGKCIGSAHES